MKPAMKMMMLSRNSERGREKREYGQMNGGMNYGRAAMDDDRMGMAYGGNGRDGDRTENSSRNYNRDNYSNARMTYGGMEDMFRDRRGREHYDNGRYAPMNSGYNMSGSARMGRSAYDDMARDSYDGGSMGGGYGDMSMTYGNATYDGDTRSREDGYRPMNRIGFMAGDNANASMSGQNEVDHNYKMDAGYRPMNEMEHRTSDRMNGHAAGGAMPLTKEMAMEWTKHMENADGTKGPHWSMEQAKQVMAQRNMACDPIEFYVALNATYSDLSPVFRKLNINNLDAYVDFAKALWIDDKDAVKDKLSAYYEYVVKH